MMPRMMRARLLFATAVAAGVFGASAAPSGAQQEAAGSITKSAGAVSATLSWKAGTFGAASPRLAIRRGGVAAADLDVSDVCKPDACVLMPDPTGPDEGTYSILHVADLDGDGEPEVMFDTFSGGAHCCITQRIYGYVPQTGSYRRRASVAWGNNAYAVKDLDHDGAFELSGSDDRFAYAFASYAGSWFPPQVLAYRVPAAGGSARLTDVTRRFPAVVRANAAEALKIIRKVSRPDPAFEVQGVVAGYVADQYLLGKASVGRAELARARSRGLVAKTFPADLLRFLKQTGYR